MSVIPQTPRASGGLDPPGPPTRALMIDWSRYVNPPKNCWFSFNAFLISLIGLYFWCLSFRMVLVNTARPDGAFNLVTLAYQKSITSSCIDNLRFCLSINKNGRIIRFQWMNQTTKRKAPSGRAVLTRTTRNHLSMGRAF
jgi:hypothetical protein